MKQAFSTKWKSSKKPRKQRKYRFNAPLHLQHKYLSAHLSKELRKKYGKRSFPAAKGDKVKIVRGQFRGRENKIDRVSHKDEKVYIIGIERTKKDGSKSMIPVRPSNIMITELNLNDGKRKNALERKEAGVKKEKQTGEEKKPEKQAGKQAGKTEEKKTGLEPGEEK